MKTSMVISRTSALFKGMRHSPGTSKWVLYRLLSNSRVKPQDLTHPPSEDFDVQQVLLCWADLAPDWPLSENQGLSFQAILTSTQAGPVNLDPVILRLAQEEKWTTLSSLVSSLDTPLASVRYLFENYQGPLPDAAVHLVRILALNTTSDLLLHLNEKVGSNPHYQSVSEGSSINEVWQSERVSQSLVVLGYCLDFMRPTGKYGSILLSNLKDLSHHCSFAHKHVPVPHTVIRATSIIEELVSATFPSSFSPVPQPI